MEKKVTSVRPAAGVLLVNCIPHKMDHNGNGPTQSERFQQILGITAQQIQEVKVAESQYHPPDVIEPQMAIFTGSPHTSTELTDAVLYRAQELSRHLRHLRIPQLRICYNAQLEALRCGATVVPLPRRNFGLKILEVVDRPSDPFGKALTEHLPDQFPAPVSNTRTVCHPPGNSLVFARDNSWEIMGFTHPNDQICSTMFHPEVDIKTIYTILTRDAKKIINNLGAYENHAELAKNLRLCQQYGHQAEDIGREMVRRFYYYAANLAMRSSSSSPRENNYRSPNSHQTPPWLF